jgi:primase-polymerase (primpol)-like protein
MYKTATMLEYATIDEAWKRSPLPVRRTYPRDTMKYTEPIAQISNDMPQQMTSSQPGAEYHRLEHRPDDLKNSAPTAFDRNEPSRASNEERERRDEDTSSDSARREPDASVAEMDVRYNDNRVEEDTTLYDVLLFGIAGIIIVLILEQFVQMGIALQRPLIRR